MAMVEIERDGALATVRYDRGAKANALNAEAIAALTRAAQDLEGERDLAAILLTGTPTRFCAGVDLGDPNLWGAQASLPMRHHILAAGGRMIEAWRRLPQIVIAAVEGPAIGGGGILALAADFRVLAEGATLRFPEVRLGMTLGWGGLSLLCAQVGPARAKRILFRDETIDAAAALALGLADQVTARGEALAAARAFAAEMAGCAPLAVAMTKRAIDAELNANWAAPYEADQFLLARLAAETGR